jgi:AraC-like DNA-binding protein
MIELPAITAHALLAGLAALGLDVARIRREVGIDGDLLVPGRTLREPTWVALWDAARRQAPRDSLAVEAGLAVPFGAFGMLDYLAASAATFGGCLDSVERYFRVVARGVVLELGGTDGEPVVTVLDTGGGSHDDDAFIVGVLVARTRLARDPVPVRHVRLRAAHAPYEALLGAPVSTHAAAAEVAFGPPGRAARLTTADPALHGTLVALARELQLGEGPSDLEVAIRSRLRLSLRDGEPEVAAVARQLGMSARTLQRRLAAAGRTWQAVVDDFRAREAERLLRDGVDVTEVGIQLGYRDTSSFTRAFRRWKGAPPSEWRRGS